MIRTLVSGDSEVAAYLDKVGESQRRGLRVGITRLALMLQSAVVRDKLSGQVLGVRTGRLRRSIEQRVEDEGGKVVGVVSTALPYGIGWELGWPGGTKESLAKAKARFSPNGDGDTFKNGTPKQRSFLRSALRDLEGSGKIGTEIEAALKAELP